MNSVKHVFLIFRTILDTIIDFVFSLVWEGSKKEIPPLTKRHSILALSAVELAGRIRRGELKSKELVRVCIERIKAVSIRSLHFQCMSGCDGIIAFSKMLDLFYCGVGWASPA